MKCVTKHCKQEPKQIREYPRKFLGIYQQWGDYYCERCNKQFSATLYRVTKEDYIAYKRSLEDNGRKILSKFIKKSLQR